MKKIYLISIMLLLIQSKNFGQMIKMDNNSIVIMRAFDRNNKITVADTSWNKLALVLHTGPDFKVESFDIAFSSGGQYFSFEQTDNKIQENAIKKVIETKASKIYFEKIRITGLGKTIYAQFIVNIQFSQ